MYENPIGVHSLYIYFICVAAGLLSNVIENCDTSKLNQQTGKKSCISMAHPYQIKLKPQ